MKKDIWFKAKRYGWGWQPCTWQGWAITGLYAVFVFLLAFYAEGKTSSESDFFWFMMPPFIVALILFIFIAYKKGEKPRWRWG